MQTKNARGKFIDMVELTEVLQATDSRTALKWCHLHNVSIQVIGKKKVTYRFLVEIELDRVLIKDLKKSYPDNWEDLYRCYTENDRYEYMLILDEKMGKSRPKSKSAPKSKMAKEFMNEFD